MKKWEDYFDEYGLIIGVNPKNQVQRGDTLQRCGMWFLFCMKYLESNKENPVYIKNNFNVATYEECARYFLDMYFCCYKNEKTGSIEKYPIRHPRYELEGGTGKTSRDQMMSNLWALTIIAINEGNKFSPTNQVRAATELELLKVALEKDYYILPANDILAPEHLAVFWRVRYSEKKNWFYKNLIRLGDYHSYLSVLVKNAEAEKTRYHCDDVNRLCMVLGMELTETTTIGRKACEVYRTKRPAWVAIDGNHYHGKPNSEYKRDYSIPGFLQALRNYCRYQEAPWDEFMEAILND